MPAGSEMTGSYPSWSQMIVPDKECGAQMNQDEKDQRQLGQMK